MIPASAVNWQLLAPEFFLAAMIPAALIFDWRGSVHFRQRALPWLGLAGLAVVLGLLFQLPSGTHETFGGLWTVDPMSRFFKGVILVATAFVLYMVRLFSAQLERGHGELVVLILTACLGMLCVASASDLLLLFVGLETVTLSFYVMCAYQRAEQASIEAALKYLLLGALATGLFLFGASLLYGVSGATTYDGIREGLNNYSSARVTAQLGALLVLAALGFKIAMIPFHLWVPDVYQGAPSPVTAFLATASKATGFVALLRFCFTAIPALLPDWRLLIAVIAALTMLVGNLGALVQTDIKRMLGFSSIGHAGYLLVGVACLSGAGAGAVGFYLLAYLFATVAAFLVIVLATRPGTQMNGQIDSYRGLGQRSPIMAATMLLALLSLAGIPPLGGFFAKFYIFVAAVEKELTWLVLIGAANVIVSLYYYLQVVRAMYIQPPQTLEPIPVKLTAKLWQYAAVAGILFLGICQDPFMKMAGKLLSAEF